MRRRTENTRSQYKQSTNIKREGHLEYVGEGDGARHLRGARARVGVPDVPGLVLHVHRHRCQELKKHPRCQSFKLPM